MSAYSFGSEMCQNSSSSSWAGDLLACVDGARDVGRRRVGALVPFVGIRSFYPPHLKYACQHTTELHAAAWRVHLAVLLGMSSTTFCSDSEVPVAQVLRLRVCSQIQHQQALPHSLPRVLWTSGMAVRLVWVPSDLQPDDPMSMGNSDFAGSQVTAEVQV